MSLGVSADKDRSSANVSLQVCHLVSRHTTTDHQLMFRYKCVTWCLGIQEHNHQLNSRGTSKDALYVLTRFGCANMRQLLLSHWRVAASSCNVLSSPPWGFENGGSDVHDQQEISGMISGKCYS